MDLCRWWHGIDLSLSDFGYFSNALKTCLIVKDSLYDSACRTPALVSLLKVNDILQIGADLLLLLFIVEAGTHPIIIISMQLMLPLFMYPQYM